MSSLTEVDEPVRGRPLPPLLIADEEALPGADDDFPALRLVPATWNRVTTARRVHVLVLK